MLVAYAPYECYASTIEKMEVDLKLAKGMGFEGVKLWNNPSMLKDGNLTKILALGQQLGLRFNFPLMISNYENFPDDATAIADFKVYLVNLANAVKGYDILWYGLWYPLAWSKGNTWNQQNVARSEYAQILQDFINILKENDFAHEVRLFADGDPWIFKFPKNFSNVDGYGVQPYSHIDDSIDEGRINSQISYFLDTQKSVYIDEYGLHTSPSPVHHGSCTSEESKAKVLADFVTLVKRKGLTATYFMLFDTYLNPTYDIGIVNNDRSLRLAGEKLRLLTSIPLKLLRILGPLFMGGVLSYIGARKK